METSFKAYFSFHTSRCGRDNSNRTQRGARKTSACKNHSNAEQGVEDPRSPADWRGRWVWWWAELCCSGKAIVYDFDYKQSQTLFCCLNTQREMWWCCLGEVRVKKFFSDKIVKTYVS